jgi:Iron/manganese superoxide dismutases, C-terminal domain
MLPLLESKAADGAGLSVVSTFFPFIGVLTRSFQGYNTSSGILEIVTTPNQDPLLTHVPIIGVDMWEHAFYLQYQNVKPDVSQRR